MARVDFNLKPSGGNGVKHYVLVKGGTGTHSAAYCVEADVAGTPIASDLNMQRRSPELVQDMLRRQANNTGR